MISFLRSFSLKDKIIVVSLIFLLSSLVVISSNIDSLRNLRSRADSSSFKLPSNISNDSSAGGTISWSGISNVTASDNNYATVTIGVNQTSHRLLLTNFGFAIPPGSIINGIEVETESHTSNNNNYSIGAILRKGNSYIGNVDFSGGNSTNDQVIVKGGQTSLWGSTWTVSDINSPDFGVGLYVSFGGNGSNTTFYLDQVRVRVYYTPPLSDTTPPTAPTNLRVTATTTNSVSLAWDASTDSGGSGLAGYKIYRGVSQIATTTSTSFTDSNLSPATSYSYYVIAYDNAGNNSSQSNTVTAMTQSSGGGDTQAPTAPGNLRVTGTTTSSISLAWNASSDNVAVGGYRVYRGGAQIGTTPATTLSYTDSGLAAGTSYSYYVKAYDTSNNLSAASNTVTANTQSPPPPRPVIVSLTANPPSIIKGQSSTISWSTANATSVTISGVGTYGANGSVSVRPSASTTYTAVASGPGGTSDPAYVSVVVNGQPAPPPPSAPALKPSIPKPPPGGQISGILNTLKLQIAVPHLAKPIKIPVLVGGFASEVEVSGKASEYQLDVRGAGFKIGQSVLVTVGGNKTLLRKISVKIANEALTVQVGDLLLGDIDADNRINESDVEDYLESLAKQTFFGDVNQDSVVNSIDWAIILLNFGKHGD